MSNGTTEWATDFITAIGWFSMDVILEITEDRVQEDDWLGYVFNAPQSNRPNQELVKRKEEV